MTTPLDDVAFLANSENRVAVLQTLLDAPQTHDEIRDRIGASRVTTARILREFEDRDWIARSGQECTITPTGEWVCDEFTRLLDELAAERRLREPLQWLPADLVTFDVRRLRDAEIVVLEESDATAIIRRILDIRGSSDRIRGVTRMVAPVFIENDWESTVHGDTQLDQVITPDVLDAVRTHSTAANQLREMLDETDVRVSPRTSRFQWASTTPRWGSTSLTTLGSSKRAWSPTRQSTSGPSISSKPAVRTRARWILRAHDGQLIGVLGGGIADLVYS